MDLDCFIEDGHYDKHYLQVSRLATEAESKDKLNETHVNRIGKYAEALAWILEKDEKYVEDIGLIARLHDLGKIKIPAVGKSGPLSVEEWDFQKNHTIKGAYLLDTRPRYKLADCQQARMAAEITLYHHEKWDGSGYPYGLKGPAIPLSARIVNMVDTFDVLASDRPYRRAFDFEQIKYIMTHGDGKLDPLRHFDPSIYKHFMMNFDSFVTIHKDKLNYF